MKKVLVSTTTSRQNTSDRRLFQGSRKNNTPISPKLKLIVVVLCLYLLTAFAGKNGTTIRPKTEFLGGALGGCVATFFFQFSRTPDTSKGKECCWD
eukprot:scaffold408_cov71-Cylindrotheca_fusiformis.AAC.14